MRPLFCLAVFLVALPLHADRVRVVVAVHDVSIAEVRAGVIESLESAKHVEKWGRGPAFSAEIDRSELAHLAKDPRVRAVSIDEGGQGDLTESLPLIGADLVHAEGFEGSGTTVAVLDTGIDESHAAFAGRIVAQRCFCDNFNGTGCCPNGAVEQTGAHAALDDNGHGTHVAGIAAGGGGGVTGVATQAKIVAVKVMDNQNRFLSFTQVYKGLEWIANERPDVRVINMSLGSSALYDPTTCRDSAISLGLKPLIATLRSRGVLIAASTGNEGVKNAMELPACMSDVIAVGAIYDTPGSYSYSFRDFACSDPAAGIDEITCFTNVSVSLDIVAPGAPITSARRGGGTIVNAGTSMASPHVAGSIAILQEVSGGLLTADQIERILEATGQIAYDNRAKRAAPRLDLAAAVSATPRPNSGPRRRAVRH